MTALPNPESVHPRRPDRAVSHTPSSQDDAIVVSGDVPIAVWRLDDHDDTGLTTDPAQRLAARLAQRLILVYSRRGDAVVDFDGDPHLHAASISAARSYVSVADPGEVADLDTLTDPVSLVVLRWPPRHAARTAAAVSDLFTACRLIMTAETSAVAAVHAAEPGEPGTTYAEGVRDLLPAALAAGLAHVLRIVAVTSGGDGDQFVYYATPEEAEAAGRDPAADDKPRYHVDLLVFTTEARP